MRTIFFSNLTFCKRNIAKIILLIILYVFHYYFSYIKTVILQKKKDV